MKNILIANPSIDTKSSWLPLLWGALKTYAEVDYEHRDVIKANYHWLKPLWHRVPVEKMLEMYPETPIDVLGISCYMWNWELNLEIARAVKERNPDCLIVAGGPQLSWQYPKDFDIVDIIVMKEGEQAFADILYQHANGDNWSECTNVIVPSQDIRTDISKLEIGELTSPWLHEAEAFREYAANTVQWKRSVNIFWETNRGCPYKCTFCDWGSDIYATVRKYDHDRMLREAEFFGELSTNFIFVTDANFGMLERDVAFAQALVDSKKRTGYPQAVFFNSAKNKKRYVNQINRLLFEAGMIYTNQLSFQHTKQPVLDAIERGNIEIGKIMDEMRDSWEIGIPVLPVLISANPGDTVELWKGCIEDTLDWGFHEDVRIHDFALLPNAPAAEQAYMDEWGIQVVHRRFPDYPPSKSKTENENKTDFIVGTKTFTTDDWVAMKRWSEMVQGLHHCPILRFIAIYLHYYQGKSYREFYEFVIENHPMLAKLRDEVTTDLYRYLYEADKELFMDADESMSKLVQPSDYVYVRCLKNIDEFYEQLMPVLMKYGRGHWNPAVIKDLLDFNRQILITPDYHPDAGREVSWRYNWREIFGSVINTCPGDFEPPQLREVNDSFTIRQAASGMYGCRPLTNHKTGHMGSFFVNVVGTSNLRQYTMYFKEAIDDWSARRKIPILGVA